MCPQETRACATCQMKIDGPLGGGSLRPPPIRPRRKIERPRHPHERGVPGPLALLRRVAGRRPGGSWTDGAGPGSLVIGANDTIDSGCRPCSPDARRSRRGDAEVTGPLREKKFGLGGALPQRPLRGTGEWARSDPGQPGPVHDHGRPRPVRAGPAPDPASGASASASRSPPASIARSAGAGA